MATVLWSVAGSDSGGGAGLAADQRAADALGVHFCPVVAAVTAQNSVAVTRVQATDGALLEAQLAALADDLPPAAIKTGLLGSADNARCLARWVDRLRRERPLALVVDPVLRASTGADLADAALLAAYREWLLPRATVVTPNRREAAALLGRDEPDADRVPALADALQELGAQAVCITGGDAGGALAQDWLASAQASGWLTLPRLPTEHTHGSGCTFAATLAAALAQGFVVAEAAVLAKMQVARALRSARPVGCGAGPVIAPAAGATDACDLPHLSTGERPEHWPQARVRASDPGVYAIVDSAERVAEAIAGGAHTVQLRIKLAADADASKQAALRTEIAAAAAAARAAGIALYINDHWQLALELGAFGVHLGQEDWLALDAADRAALAAARERGLRLGLSSHSLWELCRAAALQPDYIACGPVWPTETKRMPWQPQGLANLAWWVRHATAPVVAIGGILEAEQMRAAAAAGAAGACLLRGLGERPRQTLPVWRSAWRQGLAQRASAPAAAWPQPCLPSPAGYPCEEQGSASAR
jgi:hydroxymethylpyrimidine kinase/phosphomethylpyrimidine kinase/thiamine-phosphate diphosphorylase